MIALHTLIFYSLGLCVAFICGYGVLCYLLPDELQEYRCVIAVPVGYGLSSWLTFTLSPLFSIVVWKSAWVGFAVLSGITIAAIVTPRSRESWSDFRKGIITFVLLSASTICFVLWPFFYVGADTYLGAVNPDFTFALKDAYYTKSHISTVSDAPSDTYAPLVFEAAIFPVQGRYRAVAFATLLEGLFSLPERTALTLALAMWLTAIPGCFYFASRVALGLDLASSRLTAFLCGISGALAMSGFLFFVGQNSTLAMTPLLLALFYVLVTLPSPRIFLLASLLFCSVFWMYPLMLPYAIGPVACMAVYLTAKRRLKLTTGLGIGLGICGTFLLSVVPLIAFVPRYIASWRGLLGRLQWGSYLAEFRTERFAWYFMGLAPFPLGDSPVARWLGAYASPVLSVAAAFVAIGFVIALWDWFRHQPEKQRVVLLAPPCLLIAVLWWDLTFRQKYAYGLLKLISWVQFFVIPVAAYGVVRIWRLIRRRNGERHSALKLAVLAAIAMCWIGGNILSTLEYGLRGADAYWQRTGGVATPGVSGNPDYLELERAVPPRIRSGESIGLAFSDSIQTDWAMYYLRTARLSILSHLHLPLAEEYPDDPRSARNDFFHGAADSYYLTVNRDQPTRDIIDQPLPEPVWRDRTFQLIKADDAKDFLITGRGFYQIEQTRQSPSYWSPERFRWSAEGGEFYLFRPAKAQPYRLSLVLLSGFGLDSARRTVDFHDGKSLFDEVTINGNARVLTRTFVPAGDVERIVFRIRERVNFIPRRFAVWNASIPSDVRHLNVAVAEVRLVTPGNLRQSAGLNELVRGTDLFRRALAFDGIEGNGWLREAGTMSFVAPPGSLRVRLTLLVPNVASFRFPFAISFDIDGHKVEAVIRQPGWVVFGFPLSRSTDPRVTTLNVRPSQAFKPSGYDESLRPALQSVRFDSVVFDPAAQPKPSCSACVSISGDDLASRGRPTSGGVGKR